jgi:hypothetical protein
MSRLLCQAELPRLREGTVYLRERASAPRGQRGYEPLVTSTKPITINRTAAPTIAHVSQWLAEGGGGSTGDCGG